MNFKKTLLAAAVSVSTLLSSSSIYAHDRMDVAPSNSYYSRDDVISFTIKPTFYRVDGKPKGFDRKKNVDANNKEVNEKIGELFNNGYGIDFSAQYFFADNFATELSAGFGRFKAKKSALSSIHKNYGKGKFDPGKKAELYMVPATAMVQYHLAPYGGICPYLGAGINGLYQHAKSRAFKARSSVGFAAGAGVDLMMKDNSFFVVDFKYYTAKSKLVFKKSFLNDPNNQNDMRSNVKWNPMSFSIGFGMNF